MEGGEPHAQPGMPGVHPPADERSGERLEAEGPCLEVADCDLKTGRP